MFTWKEAHEQTKQQIYAINYEFAERDRERERGVGLQVGVRNGEGWRRERRLKFRERKWGGGETGGSMKANAFLVISFDTFIRLLHTLALPSLSGPDAY